MSSAELEELAKDSGRADTGASGETMVARLDAATTIREGQDAELWVDSRAMHIFDPSSGRNLSLGATDGGSAGTVQGGSAAAASSPAPPSPAPAGGQAPPRPGPDGGHAVPDAEQAPQSPAADGEQSASSPAEAGMRQADPGTASAGESATDGEVT